MKINSYKQIFKKTRLKLTEIVISAKPMIAVYLLNFVLDFVFDAYHYVTCLDTPMHILGGFAAAWSVVTYLNNYSKLKINTNNKYLDWFLLVSAVVVIALTWELYELIMKNVWTSIIQTTVFDTIKDMIMGVVGSLIYAYKYDFKLPKIIKKEREKKIVIKKITKTKLKSKAKPKQISKIKTKKIIKK